MDLHFESKRCDVADCCEPFGERRSVGAVNDRWDSNELSDSDKHNIELQTLLTGAVLRARPLIPSDSLP